MPHLPVGGRGGEGVIYESPVERSKLSPHHIVRNSGGEASAEQPDGSRGTWRAGRISPQPAGGCIIIWPVRLKSRCEILSPKAYLIPGASLNKT